MCNKMTVPPNQALSESDTKSVTEKPQTSEGSLADTLSNMKSVNSNTVLLDNSSPQPSDSTHPDKNINELQIQAEVHSTECTETDRKRINDTPHTGEPSTTSSNTLGAPSEQDVNTTKSINETINVSNVQTATEDNTKDKEDTSVTNTGVTDPNIEQDATAGLLMLQELSAMDVPEDDDFMDTLLPVYAPCLTDPAIGIDLEQAMEQLQHNSNETVIYNTSEFEILTK